MTTDVHDTGDQVRITTTFANSSGVDTDPTGVTFSLKTPDGIVTMYVYGTNSELAKVSTGVYYVDVTPTISGRHIFRWAATGDLVTAESGEFYARRNEAAA